MLSAIYIYGSNALVNVLLYFLILALIWGAARFILAKVPGFPIQVVDIVVGIVFLFLMIQAFL